MIKQMVDSGGDKNSLEVAAQSVSGALRIAEEYTALHGRANLDNLLRDLVPDKNYLPGDLHSQLLMLPWSDVFTTNWDTLLERAAAKLVERRYNLVLTTSDIPLRARPRIVKLHGSFPSNGPFILTEEDFRTYPQQFAPFVNMVQQSMMENVVCLIGFSGDDPNFLSWSGWVRDNLGAHKPRIYLAGLLNLRQGERQMLVDRDVIPIDLSQIFETKLAASGENMQEVALAWFFDNLKAGKPADPISWPEPKPDPPTAEAGLAQIPPNEGPGPMRENRGH